jgi:hypothetical protein
MFSTSNPALADYRVDPHELQALAGFIGGLSGAALAAAIIGGLIGYAVSCKSTGFRQLSESALALSSCSASRISPSCRRSSAAFR